MKTPTLNITKAANKDGTIHPELHELLSELITQLQNNLSDEGIQVPLQPTSNIILLNTPQSTGRFIYDSTEDLAKVNINGTFKTITTS